MASPYPQPIARTRHSPRAVTVLDPAPAVVAPDLPAGAWSAGMREWWALIWASPQAQMWDPSGVTLWGAARVHEAIATGGTSPAREAELRHAEDAHGLSPMALQRLRWRVGGPVGVVEDLDPPAVPVDNGKATSARRRRLNRALPPAR